MDACLLGTANGCPPDAAQAGLQGDGKDRWCSACMPRVSWVSWTCLPRLLVQSFFISAALQRSSVRRSSVRFARQRDGKAGTGTEARGFGRHGRYASQHF